MKASEGPVHSALPLSCSSGSDRVLALLSSRNAKVLRREPFALRRIPRPQDDKDVRVEMDSPLGCAKLWRSKGLRNTDRIHYRNGTYPTLPRFETGGVARSIATVLCASGIVASTCVPIEGLDQTDNVPPT
jgi:hypothetical protein